MFALWSIPNFFFDASPKLEGETTWQAPSNIALVKYWGKHGVQLPKNPSVSFTLSTACTTTTVAFQPKATEDKVSFELLFEGQAAPAFHPKLAAFFERITPYVPFLKQHQLHITNLQLAHTAAELPPLLRLWLHWHSTL